jgi:ComF family protein
VIWERSLNRLALWRDGPCVLCGAAGAGGLLCGPCRAGLPYATAACVRCAVPLPVTAVCGRCQRHAPPYHSVRAVFLYQDPVDFLIKGVKFNRRLGYARLLGEIMGQCLRESRADKPEMIIPVPLHKGRLRQRGFNQALELARPVARCLGVGIDNRFCTRTRATPSQVTLDAALRRRNVRGAFAVHRPRPYRHVAILDDVMTTGSTVAELARVLRRDGVNRIDVWVCARAVASS